MAKSKILDSIKTISKLMPKNISKIIILVLFAIFFGCFFAFGWYKFLNLETLKTNQVTLENFIKNNYFLTASIFILIYILAITLQVPSASILTLAGGALFGLVGVLFVNIGATVGASFSFVLSRYLFQDSAANKFPKQLKIVNEELSQNALGYLFFLRLAPVFPFFLVNILLGLTNIKLWKFVWTTALGILPGSFVYVYAGTQLASLNSLSDIVSPRVLLVFVLLGLLSLVPIVVKKFGK